jgi:drug/metabolite transporter (DMT)-like permease
VVNCDICGCNPTYGYTLQVTGQRITPPSDAAILLSLESVFAGLFGWLLINETLTMIQIAGCGLILLSVILVQINPGNSKES